MVHTGLLAGSLLEDLLIRGDLSLTVILGVRHLSEIEVAEPRSIHHCEWKEWSNKPLNLEWYSG